MIEEFSHTLEYREYFSELKYDKFEHVFYGSIKAKNKSIELWYEGKSLEEAEENFRNLVDTLKKHDNANSLPADSTGGLYQFSSQP